MLGGTYDHHTSIQEEQVDAMLTTELCILWVWQISETLPFGPSSRAVARDFSRHLEAPGLEMSSIPPFPPR